MDEVIIHLKSVNKLSIKIGLIFYVIIYLVLHNKHEIRTSCMFILALFYEGIYNNYVQKNEYKSRQFSLLFTKLANIHTDIMRQDSIYVEASLRNWLVYKLTSSPVSLQTNQLA